MCLYKYAGIFGRPRTGVHDLRIPYLDWAVTDTVFTFGLAYYTYRRTKNGSFLLHLVIWIIIGYMMHSLFGVETPLSAHTEIQLNT